jgi:hypothetical protein
MLRSKKAGLLVSTSCVWSLVSLPLFCFSVQAQPSAQTLLPRTEPKQTEPEKRAKPIVISAEKLAQAVQDDVNAAVKKYHLVELQVEGVVAAHSESKGSVRMIQFKPMVKDRKTGKMVTFVVFCSLKSPLPKGDKRLDAIAVGRRVAVRGSSFAMGNGQVTMGPCIIAPK